MTTYEWLPWVNLVLIIILIIIFIFMSFSGSSITRGVNYQILDLSGSDTSVQLATGTNVMGISNPTIQQTVVVLPNSTNKKGMTFAIANTSDSDDNFKITVVGSSNVSISFKGAGDTIIGGETAFFIALNDNNSFLRYV